MMSAILSLQQPKRFMAIELRMLSVSKRCFNSRRTFSATFHMHARFAIWRAELAGKIFYEIDQEKGGASLPRF
ncbi:hypothetical protein [Rhizobium azibense]|uniref:hypothetical protein n=1 Tax=Rhizobium azibense TaxID=1136135 RepID=UPI0010428B8F|nr:hypothetical protein [Rhizobium azibense]